MVCAFCKSPLIYVHGHAACGQSGCPQFGVNQAECCSGETAANGPLTAEVSGAQHPAATFQPAADVGRAEPRRAGGRAS